ncbi:hypothetical protein M9H77_07774 [Catharanthus roseus]|uniref:Uncharacterized protein n=1 Tax=Catharanthus roseus TaxID=4058 RepID=A0ACC0BW34_CATRO|nr:hypothetical protein M9H77_07774 [Catharanthus roseus]
MRLSFGVTYLEKQKRHTEIIKHKKEKQLPISSQGIVKKEIKKSSIIEESQRAIELLQVKEVARALVEVYVINEDSCDFKKKKRIEEEKKSEIQEKERVERKESLVEESCFFYSISSLFEELENDECVQEEEDDLEKKENKRNQ